MYTYSFNNTYSFIWEFIGCDIIWLLFLNSTNGKLEKINNLTHRHSKSNLNFKCVCFFNPMLFDKTTHLSEYIICPAWTFQTGYSWGLMTWELIFV